MASRTVNSGGVEVDIAEFEVARFPHTQPGHAQQAEQAVIDPRQQCAPPITVRHVERGPQQAANLFIEVQMRLGPLGLKRQQSRGRNLRTWVRRLAIPREATHVPQSRRPC